MGQDRRETAAYQREQMDAYAERCRKDAERNAKRAAKDDAARAAAGGGK